MDAILCEIKYYISLDVELGKTEFIGPTFFSDSTVVAITKKYYYGHSFVEVA